jgi:hypothetical protein
MGLSACGGGADLDPAEHTSQTIDAESAPASTMASSKFPSGMELNVQADAIAALASVNEAIAKKAPPADAGGVSRLAATNSPSPENAAGGKINDTTVSKALPIDDTSLSSRSELGAPNLPQTAIEWSTLARSFEAKHEARPLNVPAFYDWASNGVMHVGNRVPAGWAAMTAWGHVFNSTDAVGAPEQALEIRHHQTFLCTSVRGETRWTLAQKGEIEGAAFRADFRSNENVAARVTRVSQGEVRVSFDAGRAFHFWPKTVRVDLPREALCGMLVLAQARAVRPDGHPLVEGEQPTLLFGLGADYWTTRTAAWDNFKTNASVGVGQLRLVTPQWQWFGVSTASATDLQHLRAFGKAN